MMASCIICSQKIQSMMLQSTPTARRHLPWPIQKGYCQNTEQRIKDMGKKSFWNAFYDKKKLQKKTFDWFFEYKDIRSVINGIIEELHDQKAQKALKVLDVGCGTSSMALKIAHEHKDLAKVWCMDFSNVALQELKSQQDELLSKGELVSDVDYVVADAMNLPFQSESFDLILEKGTLDAMLKTQHLSQRSPFFIAEVVRVLGKDGIYCQFSDEDPEIRLPLLEEAKRHLQMFFRHEIAISYKSLIPESSIHYFMYSISHKSKRESR